MKRLLSLALLLFPLLAFSQDSLALRTISSLEDTKLKMNFRDNQRGNSAIRAVFYNVENLFDVENDSLTHDDEFTPEGSKRWSYYRYRKKLKAIYKTMIAVGGWEPPAIIGFCEIENRKVLNDLIRFTPFLKFDYKVVHEDSPDRRGIDVGLIYRANKFKVLTQDKIRIRFPLDSSLRTRDILYVKGIVLNKDTLHLFVNHWPSRRGGQAESEHKRVFVANQLRKKVDEILLKSPEANILIMGDLNDEVKNKSVVESLRAKVSKDSLGASDLYNYLSSFSKSWTIGSHKYREHWGVLDHLIASAPLVNRQQNGLVIADEGGQIFTADFLLEADESNFGVRPKRTYLGPRYLGGFSDHLPVFIDILLK